MRTARDRSRAVLQQERGLAGPLAALRELLTRDEVRPHGELELIAQRRLEHLRPVRVEAEVDLVLAEDRDEVSELVQVADDLRIEVRRRADLQMDPPLREPLAKTGVLRGVDPMADAVWLEMGQDLVDRLPVLV